MEVWLVIMNATEKLIWGGGRVFGEQETVSNW